MRRQPGVRARPARRTVSASRRASWPPRSPPTPRRSSSTTRPTRPAPRTRREELEAIAEVCVREQIWVIADEIYEKLSYDGLRFTSIASLEREDQEAHDRHQRLLQGVRDDRVAARLRRRPARDHRRLLQGAVAQHLQRDLVRAEGGGGGAQGVRDGDRADAPGVRAPPQRHRLPPARPARASRATRPPGAFYVMPNVAALPGPGVPGGADPQHLRPRLLPAQGGPRRGRSPARRSAPTRTFGSRSPPRWTGSRRGRSASSRRSPASRSRGGCARARSTTSSPRSPTTSRPGRLRGSTTRNALLAECESHLPADAYFEWNAAIAGIVVQLRTSSPHLADFYQENFYPAPLEGDLEPHAVIYAVKDVPGREPSAMLSLETSTGFVFNTAFYGQVRSLALELAAEAAQRSSGALLAHCAAIDVDGARRARLGRSRLRTHGAARRAAAHRGRQAGEHRQRARPLRRRRHGSGPDRAQALPRSRSGRRGCQRS